MSYWASGTSDQLALSSFSASNSFPAFHSVNVNAHEIADNDFKVPYQSGKWLNSGNAMDSDKGIFTAKVRGIYHFYFASIRYQFWKKYPSVSDCTVQMLKNGVDVVTIAHVDTNAGQADAKLPMYGQATLLLEPGDTMSTKILKICYIVNWEDISAAFMGFLVVPVPKVKDK